MASSKYVNCNGKSSNPKNCNFDPNNSLYKKCWYSTWERLRPVWNFAGFVDCQLALAGRPASTHNRKAGCTLLSYGPFFGAALRDPNSTGPTFTALPLPVLLPFARVRALSHSWRNWPTTAAAVRLFLRCPGLASSVPSPGIRWALLRRRAPTRYAHHPFPSLPAVRNRAPKP
jgi:hypothetical protein